MSIIRTITNEYEFYEWLKQSDNYKNNFSVEGAKAVQAYCDELSEDIGEQVEFDPIAWCCEFSEHDTALEAYNQHHGIDNEGEGTAVGEDNTPENAEVQALEWLQDNTTVLELDNGHVVIQEFKS